MAERRAHPGGACGRRAARRLVYLRGANLRPEPHACQRVQLSLEGGILLQQVAHLAAEGLLGGARGGTHRQVLVAHVVLA